MKRIELNHISEYIKNIVHISVCDDISSHSMLPDSQLIAASSEDAKEMTDDEYYATFTDEQLLELSRKEVAEIGDVNLLERLAKLDRSKLSANQLKILRDHLGKKVVISESDVRIILQKLKRCTSISYEGNHLKTNRFLFDNKGHFRKDDCLEIIKNLKVEDYVASTRSYNPRYLGNNLIIFQPKAAWKFNDGGVVNNLKVYVKLDIDKLTGNCVALVSMHSTRYRDKRPYSN